MNKNSGVHLQGFNAQKANFTKTINIKQIGHAVLAVPNAASEGGIDTYIITLPSLHVEGLLFGAPFIELDGASYISSSTGFTAKIDYSGKGWLSGKKNSFTATLYPSDKDKDILYNVSGQWTKAFEIHSGSAKTNSTKTLVDTWDPEHVAPSKLQVAPVEQQHPLETRRAWGGVAGGIAKGDMTFVGQEKTKIENAQRELRKKEQAEGRVWERRYFNAIEGGDPMLAALASHVGLDANGDADKTGGLWRFDAAKADKVRDETLSEEEKAAFAKEVLGQ